MNPFTLKTWPNRLEFRLYIRKDLARQVWGYRLGEAGSDAYILGADDAFARRRSFSSRLEAFDPAAVFRAWSCCGE